MCIMFVSDSMNEALAHIYLYRVSLFTGDIKSPNMNNIQQKKKTATATTATKFQSIDFYQPEANGGKRKPFLHWNRVKANR